MANTVISRLFSGFERSSPPWEINPLNWNLSLVLRSFTCLWYEPMKLFSDSHLTWKTCFLLALASAKRDSELHRLSYQVRHSNSWRSCTFSFLSDFVTVVWRISLVICLGIVGNAG